MPRSVLLFSFLVLFVMSTAAAQADGVSALEKKVTHYNDALHYEKSIQLLSGYISDETTSPYEKYEAYILKSYTYKRLFNYEETLRNLDLALAEGLKSDKKAMVGNTIKSEKAFVYFDIHDYSRASKLMSELASAHYRYLSPENKSFIIMQEGYLLMLDKKYRDAEAKFDEAIAITRKHAPRNLPNIYGKKMELYNVMKRYDKRDAAFAQGLAVANAYNVIKYKLYLYEVLRNQFQQNDDYKNAFAAQKKYDSLNRIYNATSSNGRIQILEKQIDARQKELEVQNERNIRYFLLGLILILAILLVVSYRLFRSNKERRLLAEKENARIHLDIEHLTKAIDEKGNVKIDLSKFDLTERQVEIIELIKLGKSNKEIAAALFISENTVKYHLKIIYEILNIEHRLELK